MKFFSKPNNRLVFRFLFPNICILLLTVLLFLNSYNTSSNIMKNYIQDSSLVLLNQAKQALDDKLSQMDRLSFQLSNNKEMLDIFDITLPIPDDRYWDYKLAIDSFSNLIDKNISLAYQKDIEGSFILMTNTHKVITPTTMYPARTYYSQVLKLAAGKYDEWCDFMRQERLYQYFISSEDADRFGMVNLGLVYIQSLPRRYPAEHSSALVIHLSKSQVAELFSPVLTSNASYIFIENENGEKIIDIVGNFDNTNSMKFYDDNQNFFTEHINNQKMIISHTVSEMNGWRYITMVSEDVIFHDINNYKLIILLVLILVAGVGTMVSIYLAYFNTKPIISIATLLEEAVDYEFREKDSFSMIRGGISELINTKQALQEDIDRHLPILKSNFINNLIKGEIYNHDELSAIASFAGINISHEIYQVFTVKVLNDDSLIYAYGKEDIEQINIWKAVVRSGLYQFLGNDILLYDIDHQSITVIIGSEKKQTALREEIESEFIALNNKLSDKYGKKIMMGAGDTITDLLQMWRAVEQSRDSVNYATETKPVVWFDKNIHENVSYYYPLELEQRIINFARSGDMQEADKLLKLTAKENLESGRLSANSLRELIIELKSTLLKAISGYYDDDNEIKSVIAKIGTFRSGKENIDAVHTALEKITTAFSRKKNDVNQELLSSIKEYIVNNYSDSDMNLYKVSSQFNFSEGYFSYIFKEQAGVNFTDFLEETRLNHANEMLKNSTDSIDVIAQKVGYNNAQTFRRAFKKIYGVSPSALRKI